MTYHIFYEIMFSVTYLELKWYFLLKTVIYNIIEQHEHKKMALTYNKNILIRRNMRRTRRMCRISCLCNAFLLAQLKKLMYPPEGKCQMTPLRQRILLQLLNTKITKAIT